MKRLVVVILLLSMVLHSASRLGVLSYVYQQRHEIAYALGIIEELPIALCSHNYSGNSGEHLVVAADETDGTPPRSIVRANEIQLFYNTHLDIFSEPVRTMIDVQPSVFLDKGYCGPILSIFHPPS